MTSIPFLAGVATFIFSIAPRETLGPTQHPPFSHSLWVYGAIRPFPHMFQGMKLNEAKRQVYLYFL